MRIFRAFKRWPEVEAVTAPVTNQVTGYPFEVQISAGRKVSGVVLSDQIKSLDWQIRRAEFI